MIDRDAGFRIEICPDNKRDHETLLRLIQKHVRPNTTIITDKWKGYIGLQNEGFGHMTVNPILKHILKQLKAIGGHSSLSS
jgi:transposase-like protein